MKTVYCCLLSIMIFAPFSAKCVENVSINQNGKRELVLLNGEWDVLPIKGTIFNYPPAKSGWQKELVPHKDGVTRTIKSDPYVLQAKKPLKTGKLGRDDKMASWFRRSFTLPAVLPKDKRIFLHYGGIAYRSETWLNGHKLGTSYQCAVPVEYDVTKYLKPGRNTLTVGITGAQGIVDFRNRTLMTPAYGMSAGIRDEVSLRFLPKSYVDDIFIKTSVKNKMLEADITLVNSSDKSVNVVPSLMVFDRNNIPQFNESSQIVELAVGESKVVTIKKPWLAPELWDVEKGAMYTATVVLKQNDVVVDKADQTFGFREFEIRGKDFYLNGVKKVLLRTSSLTAMGRKPKVRPLSPDVRSNPNNPRNCIRLHLGQNNKAILDEADKVGLMIQPESSWNHVHFYPLDKKDIWLPNTLEYYRRWIKHNRNRPSVIMWTLANETFWGRVPETPAMKEIAKEIVKTVRATDPTRPLDGDAEVGWDGLLDVISIHYPGLPGKLSKKYPNSGFIVPNDLYWLKEKGNHSWRAAFDWDKPLSLGEYWNIEGSPDYWSSCGGEDTYNWVKYSMQDRNGRSDGKKSSFTEVLKKATDAYRVQGVACLNPWAGNDEETMPRIAVRPLDFHPNYYGGKTVNKKLAIFYESNFTLNYSRLQCFITVNGKKVWENTVNVYVKPGDCKVLEIPITPPKVMHQQKAELSIRLMYHAGGKFHEKARHSEPIFIMPEVSIDGIDTSKVVLLDSEDETAAALERLDFGISPQNSVDAADLDDKKLLIVGGGFDVKANKEIILDFVNQGGSTIFLQRESWDYISNGFPEPDNKHLTTRSWKRSYNHPVVSAFDNRQLSYWRPNNLVGQLNFLKPYDGDLKVILDAAGSRGMEWTPLCETTLGKGLLIFSQLSLIDRLGVEPAADKMVENMVKYALKHKPEMKPSLRLLAKNNEPLENILKICRVQFTKGLDGNGPILLDTSYPVTKSELSKIKKYVEDGGKLWVHNFDPKTAEKVSELLPFEAVMKPIDKKITAAVRLSDSSLMHNLSTRDFFWTSANVGVRGEYLKGATPTAKLGDYELILPTLHSGTKLLEPALLVEIPHSKGLVLFDTLQWEKAYETEGDLVVRIVSSLVANLGCEISKPQEKKFDYFPVDIAQYANMGYVDEVEQDGQGGWLDTGKADLCFFLINHTGLGGGVGMPVSVPPFPEENRFCKIPFKLTAPKKNNGKGMISLRSTDRALMLPDSVKGIPVNRKADKLFFIHSANYVPKEKGVTLANYVINYEDGSTNIFPIRSWMEIGDWCNPKKVEKARICWTGRNRTLPMVGLYLTTWDNPHPEKSVKSIDIVGAFTKAQIGLVGISGARRSDSSKVIAQWNLGSFNGRTVNEGKGRSSLFLYDNEKGAPKPAVVNMNAEPALRFSGSQCLRGNLANITAYSPEKPFSVKVTFSLDELPKKHNRSFGLYQAMEYMKSGFRLIINTDGRVGLSVFTGDNEAEYFEGKTEMTLGKSYTIQVSFEKNFAKIYLNGKLEKVARCSMPAPYKKGMIIGHASGMGSFKGSIKDVELMQ